MPAGEDATADRGRDDGGHERELQPQRDAEDGRLGDAEHRRQPGAGRERAQSRVTPREQRDREAGARLREVGDARDREDERPAVGEQAQFERHKPLVGAGDHEQRVHRAEHDAARDARRVVDRHDEIGEHVADPPHGRSDGKKGEDARDEQRQHGHEQKARRSADEPVARALDEREHVRHRDDRHDRAPVVDAEDVHARDRPTAAAFQTQCGQDARIDDEGRSDQRRTHRRPEVGARSKPRRGGEPDENGQQREDPDAQDSDERSGTGQPRQQRDE